eukprot:gene9103-10748_t
MKDLKVCSRLSLQALLRAVMLLSRFILKVNYKDPKALLYSRATFVAYLVLFQALIWLLKYQINKRDDHTILATSPSSGMDSLLNTVGRISGQSAMTNTLLSLSKLTNGAAVKTLTVKAHDLEHVQKLSSKLYFDLAMTSLLHYLFGFQSLVLLTPMRGLASLLKNQLVLLHVFRFKPVGKLARPFKTPFEEFIGSLANPKTPASAQGHVESAENSPKSAQSGVSKTRVDKIASSLDATKATEAATGENSVEVTADDAVVDDSDQVEQATENEEEQEEEEGEDDEGEETASVNDDTEAQEDSSDEADVNDEKEEESADNEAESEELEGEESEMDEGTNEADAGEEGTERDEEQGQGEGEDDDAEDDSQDAPEDNAQDTQDDDTADVEQDEEGEDEGAEVDGTDGEADADEEEEEIEDSELLEAIDHFGEW